MGNNRGTSSTSTTATLSSFAPTTSTAAATAAPTDYYQVLSSPPVPGKLGGGREGGRGRETLREEGGINPTNQPNILTQSLTLLLSLLVFDHSFTLFLNDSLLVSIGGTWETKDLTNYYLSSPEASTITQSQPLSPFNSSSYSSVLFLNATSVFEWYLPPPSSQLPPHLYGLAGHSSVALADGNQIMILFGRNDPRAVAAATSNMSRSSSSGSLLTTTSTISTTTSKPSLVPPPPPPPYFTSTSDVWLFDASSFAWRPLLNQTGSLPPPRHHHVSLYNSSNSRIFVVGGVLNGSSSSLTPPITSLAGLGRIDRSLYYLDLPPLPPPPSPSSSSSSSSPTLTTSVQTPSSSSLPSSLLRAGSIRSNSSSSSSYWPASGNWTRIPPADQSIAQSGFAGSSAVMVNQYILLCFGTMDGAVQPNNLCSIFNTDTMSYDTPIYNTTL